METLLYMFLLFSFLLIFYKLISKRRVQHKNFPPSPPGLPMIGHLHLLKKPIHLTLHNLTNRYGDILSLRMGCRPVLVITTPSAIKDCFTKNDIIFSNRPCFPSKNQLEYNFTALGTGPYGHLWRTLRQIIVIEIFSSSCIQMSSSIRNDEARFFTKQLFAIGARKVDLNSFFYMLFFNIMLKMASGNRYFNGIEMDSDKAKHELDDIKQTFTPTSTMALGDFFPFLRWLTFLGAVRQNMKQHKKRDAFLQALIDTHRNNRSSSSVTEEKEQTRTLIDVMLSLQDSEPELYTQDIIKGTIQIMLIAGIGPASLTLESAVSFLISHPHVFQKARDEIDANVEQSRLLDDGDLAKLTYLGCILNESLRLGPSAQIIPPRESSEECIVGGFNVPKGTMLMVNARTLHKNPKVWEDPTMFKPERFEGTIGKKGGFNFIPFGTGRRRCPGASLAMKLMELTLGTLIQCFDWEKLEEDCMDTEMKMDMAMNKPVEIVFWPRRTLINALSQL